MDDGLQFNKSLLSEGYNIEWRYSKCISILAMAYQTYTFTPLYIP